MYRTIDNCNTAISITATGDDDTPDFRYSQGQAYALRAFVTCIWRSTTSLRI